jgi:drug/metabolite transporter (DMT)-like permease
MPLSNNLRGSLFMVVAMAAFTLNDACMKAITADVPLFQAIAMRGVLTVGVLAVMVWATAGGQFTLRGRDARVAGIRAVAEVLATITFIAALMHMPLANLSAIFQALPFTVTLAAAVFFGDRIGWRRMTAIVIGFLGVMLIVRPGTAGFDMWSLMALASVATAAARDLATRELSAHVPSVTVAFWTASLLTVTAGLVMLGQGWQAPAVRDLWLIPLAAFCVVLGYLFIIKTMRVGDIGFVAPFRYTALIWAIGLGWIMFGTLPDGLTLLGGTIVIATGVFTLYRGQKLAQTTSGAVVP